MSSTPGKSNIVPLGCYQPPYKEPFDSLEAIDAFVVIDGNKDGITWHIGNFLGSTKVCIYPEARLCRLMTG